MLKTIIYLLNSGNQIKKTMDTDSHDTFRTVNAETILGSYDISNQLVLNIGMGNNPKTIMEVLALIELQFGTDKFSVRIANGQWNNKPEKTVVAGLSGVDLWSWELISFVRNIGVECKQEAIAIKYNGAGAVVNMDPTNKDVVFDDAFFHDANKKFSN